jgi:hypothetical protein
VGLVAQHAETGYDARVIDERRRRGRHPSAASPRVDVR